MPPNKYLGLRGEKLALVRILLVVLPSFLLFGYNQSAIGGVLNFKSFTNTFPRIDTANTKGAQKTDNSRIQGKRFPRPLNSSTNMTFPGTVVAIYTLGCLVGALASTSIGNPLGRRRSLIIFAIVAAVGTILQGSAFSLGQLIGGRIISGVGVGGVNAVVPVWQAECTKPKNRGKNVVVLGIFIASGIAIAAWVNVGLSFHQQSSVCWRLPLSLPFVFCVLICLGVFCFPESPRWLVQKGRREDAKATLAILDDMPADSEHIGQEIDIIQRAWDAESSRETGFLDLLRPGRERLQYRTFLAITINFCAQMTGEHSKKACTASEARF